MRSGDRYAVLYGLWGVAALRDTAFLPEVEALAAEGSDLRRNTASVVAMLLRGNDDEILRRIAEHDHDRMPFLARAAAFIGTDEALQTLKQGSQHAPDEQCRTFCGEMLAEGRERRTRSA